MYVLIKFLDADEIDPDKLVIKGLLGAGNFGVRKVI